MFYEAQVIKRLHPNSPDHFLYLLFPILFLFKAYQRTKQDQNDDSKPGNLYPDLTTKPISVLKNNPLTSNKLTVSTPVLSSPVDLVTE